MEVLDEATPETKPPEEGRKPKIIRNREVDKAAKELADDYTLPLPPGKTLTWEQMQEYLHLFTPAMWNHTLCYLYRLKPKIRRQLRDPNCPSYIDCYGEAFTLDQIIQRHGGGKYQIQATDTDNKGTGPASLFRCNLDINDSQHLPILEYAELELEAKENKSYIEFLKVKGILAADGKPVAPAQPAAPSAAPALSAKDILQILEFTQKMSNDQQAQFRAQFAPNDPLGKSIGDILLEKMRQDDPGKDWDRMMAFMEKLHKPDNPMADVIQLMQSQITNGQQLMQAQLTNGQEQRKTDLAYLQMILDSQKREGSPRNQFAEFRDMIGLARELMGSGNGRRNGWDTGLEIAREVALPAIQSIGGIISNIMALRSTAAPVPAGAAPARPAAPAAPFDPYRNPGAARQYASTLPQQPPAPPPGQAPPPPPPPEPTDAEGQLLSVLTQYGGLIVNHLNSGTTGYDFGDYVAGLLGTGAHANMCAPGEAVLATVMMRVPEIAIFGESRIRQFVNEFVHYQEFIEAASGEEMPDEEPEPEPEIVDPQPEPKFFRPPAKAATARGGKSS